MSKFSVGDEVVGNEKAAHYKITRPGYKGKVTEVFGRGVIEVNGFVVREECFDLAQELKLDEQMLGEADTAVKPTMKEYDISHESWREYDYGGSRTYRIERPVKLFIKEGGTGHRILDASGVTHWVPVNVWHCIRWLTLPENGKPVEF